MLFIKFLKQQFTKTYAKLTVLGKLLLTLQIASMFIPIIDPQQPLLLHIFFVLSIIFYIPVSMYLVAEYCSFVVDSYDEPIEHKDFLKITTIPFLTLATISIISFFIIDKLAIIQFVFVVPVEFIICAHIASWIEDLPEIKLPKLNIKKLFVKEIKRG